MDLDSISSLLCFSLSTENETCFKRNAGKNYSFLHWNISWFCSIIRRDCNSRHGTLECWQQTTDGFTYGLSTAMIDYCQVVLQLRQMNNPSWYNISRDILIERIEKYNLDKSLHQLNKTDIEQVSLLILNKVRRSLCYSN